MATSLEKQGGAPAAPKTENPLAALLSNGLPPNAQRALAVVLGVLAILLPFLLDPISGFLSDSIIALAYVVLALGLNVVVGFAGLLDLGYVAFFAIGAYTVGWLSSTFIESGNVHFLTGVPDQLLGIHLGFPIVVVVSVILCALGGILIGLPTLRLRGDYIAIVTLAFGEIIRIVAINGDSLKIGGQRVTAGKQGISPVDKIKLPGLEQFGNLDLRPWYWTILALTFFTLFIVIRLRDSRLGRAWIAIREDEVAAASMGVPLVKTKLYAYAVGAGIGGISGAFQASYLNTVNADQFAFNFSILVLAMVILGGLGSIWGVVLGAIALSFLNNYFIPDVFNNVPSKLGLDFQTADINFGIFGFILLIVMVLKPEGLLPERRRKLELTEGVGNDDIIFEAKA